MLSKISTSDSMQRNMHSDRDDATRVHRRGMPLLKTTAWTPVLISIFHIEKSVGRNFFSKRLFYARLGMNVHEVLRAGFRYTSASITLAMLMGLGLGYLIHAGKKSAFLVTAGTAICRGSVIGNADAVIRSIEKWGGREIA